MYRLFLSCVVDWDMIKKQGSTEKVPLTVEGLKEARIPAPVIGYLYEEVIKDYRLGEKSAAGGSSTLKPAASSETLPPTGPGSESPTTSTTVPSGS